MVQWIRVVIKHLSLYIGQEIDPERWVHPNVRNMCTNNEVFYSSSARNKAHCYQTSLLSSILYCLYLIHFRIPLYIEKFMIMPLQVSTCSDQLMLFSMCASEKHSSDFMCSVATS